MKHYETILCVTLNMYRACGVTLLRKEKDAWFPAEELRDDNNVQPHKVERAITM